MQLVQRGYSENPGDRASMPFKYVVQIGDSDSNRAPNWLLTISRPTTLVPLWTGEKIRHLKVWYRLPAKLVKVPAFQQYAKSSLRYIYGRRKTEQLEKFLASFLKK